MPNEATLEIKLTGDPNFVGGKGMPAPPLQSNVPTTVNQRQTVLQPQTITGQLPKAVPLTQQTAQTPAEFLALARQEMREAQEKAYRERMMDEARERANPKQPGGGGIMQTLGGMFRPASPDARQAAGFASMGLSSAGFHGAAGVVGGYAALGPAGAALAAIELVKETVNGALQTTLSFGQKIAALDVKGMAHGLTDVTEKLPIFGSTLGILTKGTLGLSDAFQETAQRLSQYSGPLAMQQAQIEVRDVLRDMRRAQEFGPQIMAAVEARQNFNEHLQDVIDENLPTLVQLANGGLEILKLILAGLQTAKNLSQSLGQSYLTAQLEGMSYIADILGPDSAFAKALHEASGQLQQINQNTAPPFDSYLGSILGDFDQMYQRFSVTPQARPVGVQV